MFLHRIRQFLNFYAKALTKYQLHSPFVYELTNAVFDEERYYYAFRDIEAIRKKMLGSSVVLDCEDFGTGGKKEQVRRLPLSTIVRRASSKPGQGRRLFRLVNYLHPGTILELGTSAGIGAMYLASAARLARFISLEGCIQTAGVARANLEILGLHNLEIISGNFDQTLLPALQKIQSVDFVYLDGNHRCEPSLRYFENCLQYAHINTVFVFDDAYWSPEMTVAWQQIKDHPKVRLTLDFFDLSLAFINPDFREKQHIRVIPAKWKPWKIY